MYPVRGKDRWIAIVAGSDAEWRSLHGLLPESLRKKFPADLSTQERLARRDELDAELARWSASWSGGGNGSGDGDALAAALQQRGVPAYIVCDGRDLLRDPQLGFRQHYRFPEHAKLGPSLVDAPSFRISSVEPRLVAGPMYAADGVEVLEDWLGIDADALADLVASGAIVV